LASTSFFALILESENAFIFGVSSIVEVSVVMVIFSTILGKSTVGNDGFTVSTILCEAALK
jgi:hypothetical protein